MKFGIGGGLAVFGSRDVGSGEVGGVALSVGGRLSVFGSRDVGEVEGVELIGAEVRFVVWGR